MAEIDAMYWTFSTMFQGLCALYGLLLVWYVYMMTGLEKDGRELCEEYGKVWGAADFHKAPFVRRWVSVGDGQRVAEDVQSYEKERVADMKEAGEFFIDVRRHERKEKVGFLLLSMVSVGFMVAGSVLVYGLTTEGGDMLFWGGTVVGLLLVWFISGVFAGYGAIFKLRGVKESEGWRVSRTSVRNVVKRGRWFFEEGLLLDPYIDYVVKSREDLREGSYIDVWKGHFELIDMTSMKKEWDELKKFWCGW